VDMKSLTISEEDAMVHSKCTRLIMGTEGIVTTVLCRIVFIATVHLVVLEEGS